MSEGAGEFKDTRQTGFKNFFPQMVKFQFCVWPPRTITAAAFTDFDHDGTRHHVTARQVFGVRRITLHKAFAMFVQQITAFTTATFGDQYARTGNTGRVELPHFHILYRYACTDSHADTVASVNVGVSGGLINTPCPASRQHCRASFKVNHFTSFDAQCGTTDHCAILVFHQIQRIPLGENGGVVFQVLLIKGVQQCVTGTVGSRRSTCRLLAAEVFRLTAKRTLIDTTIIKTRERQAHMFQFQNRFRPGFTHIFNRVLVTDIVRPFYGVVHMPFPVIFMGITQRNGNTTLRRNGMGTGREDFREQRTGLATLGNLQRRAHTCAASTNHNCIKFSDWQFHHTPHTTTNP